MVTIVLSGETFEAFLPFLIPVILFAAGLIGYGVLVLLTRWRDGS